MNRQRYLGGSDAAAIAGVSPWKSRTDVWLAKTGRYKPELSSPALYWGTVLENVVAKEYAERNDVRIRRRRAPVFHPVHEFIGGHVDRMITDHPGILECKTSNNLDAWSDGVPANYQMQVQHYMACMAGIEYADVAVLIMGRDFRTYRIERNDELIAGLVRAEVLFWQYVQTDQEPPPELEHKTFRDTLVHLFPETVQKAVELADTDQDTWAQWCQIKADESVLNQTLKDLKARRRPLENRLITIMRDAKYLDGPTGRITRSIIEAGDVAYHRERYDKLTYKPNGGTKS